MIEFECEDCHIWTVKIVGEVMPPEGERVCAVCEFIRSAPEEDRERMRQFMNK